MKKKFTLSRAMIWIFSSAVLINLIAYVGILTYRYFKNAEALDYEVPIKAIVQTGPQREALRTNYLAELLGLCINRPILCTEFDLKQAKEILLTSPVIQEADVKLKEPGILYIDYTIRKPLCYLKDFKDVALDDKKVPFPTASFFTPKKLPEIYLGMDEEIMWNEPLRGEKIELAFQLLKILTGPIVSDLFNVKLIDVSSAFESSCGRREIVLMTEDELLGIHNGEEVRHHFPKLLRLSTKNYASELSNYLKLREQILEQEEGEIAPPEQGEKVVAHSPKVIDFRIPQIAFIENGTSEVME